MTRCEARCPQPPTPEGMPVETVARSPRHRHLLEPGARCELELEHAGPHRNGGLLWNAPPIIVGRSAGVGPLLFSWEREPA